VKQDIKIHAEISHGETEYLYKAVLDNGDTINVKEGGVAEGESGRIYHGVWREYDDEEFELLGWSEDVEEETVIKSSDRT